MGMFIDCDTRELLGQIDRMTVLAVSGGRVTLRDTGITLPVRYGYSVTVDLDASDTYTVRRVFTRGGKVTVKGELANVYFDEVSEAVYRAACYLDPMPTSV